MLSLEKIISHRIIDPLTGLYQLVLRGGVASAARPGQFVHLKVGATTDPLLRRPISIAHIDRPQGEITLFYRVTGRGTALLTGVKEKETLSVIGPLGNGFTVPQEGELLLLAGGIGIFPLFSLLDAVDRSRVKVKVLWGAENDKFLESAGLATLMNMEVDYEVSTLDGSMGQKGLVTDLLTSYLSQKTADRESCATPRPGESQERSIWRAAACGPRGMLKAVTEICRREGAPVEVSLEERMGCGVGACLGCVCTVQTATGALERRRVCTDGPVFDGREVFWDED